ncbi:MAG TPA: beta-ketoacyl synthase chain length factor [Parvibaculum sp.]|jgi:hypothetical protein
MIIGDIGEALAPISAAYVESWAAIMLGAVDGVARRFGACVDESVIPAGHRRRLGTYGRMAVSCGLSIAAADSSDLVFCSRYGDVDLAHRLLTELVAGGLLSPAAFSMSVHNAVPGVMDLVRKSRAGHTAIAAGTQSFSAGLAEAWGKLDENRESKIALVYADCALPAVYQEFSDMKLGGTALAMMLSTKPSATTIGQFSLGRANGDIRDAPNSEVLAGLLIGALNGEAGASPVSWQSRGLRWSFEAGSNASA